MTPINIRRLQRVDVATSSLRNVLLIVGAVLTTGAVNLCGTAEAQSFIPMGPVYPGERIVSERVITPKAEPLPAPSNRSLSGQEQEPVSLSDSLRSQSSGKDSTSSLSLGSEIWQRLLTLERENAELTAMLDYERRLATYREHSENKRAELNQQSNELKQKLAKLEKGRDERLARAELELQETRHELFQLASELQRARQDLRYRELDRNDAWEPRINNSNSETTSPIPAESQLAKRPAKIDAPSIPETQPESTIAATKPTTKGKRSTSNELRLQRVDKLSAPTTKASKRIQANRSNRRQPSESDPSFDPEAWMRVETDTSKMAANPGLQGGPMGPLGKLNAVDKSAEQLPKPRQSESEVLPSPKLPEPAKSKQPKKGNVQATEKSKVSAEKATTGDNTLPSPTANKPE